jgi:hypothetical protein
MSRNDDRHELLQAQLPLAAAGALSSDELSRLLQHAGKCESCRRELEVWGFYARGLQQLPQPVIPADLISRTHRAVLKNRTEAIERRTNGLMLGALAVFSWVISFAFWIVVRALTGGTWELLGTNIVDAGPWLLFSSMLTWITAGVAAVTLGSQRQARRFL